MKNKNNQGFTLIELLVVIAIIGILSGIVLIGLGGARDRARDTRITSGMSQVRSIAESINAAVAGGFTTVCSANTLNEGAAVPFGDQLRAIETDITAQQGGTLSLVCHADATRYCISANLIAAGQGRFCIDSTGVARVIAPDVSPCNGTTVWTCP